jgi:glycosyltransferase involved in cell wall biosynthesis
MLKRLGFITYYIPLGVDTSLFKPSLNKYDCFTVILTKSRWQSGIDFAFSVINEILKNHPKLNIKFILIDSGFLQSIKRVLVKKFPENVLSLEFMPQSQLAEIFAKSHLLLFPSRWESFGLVVVEALSSGMPVVAFDIPGAPRDVLINGVTGSVVKPFDVRAMIGEVLKYYKIWERNPKEFARISDKCRRYALNFDWNIIADHFDKMFKAVVEERRK